MPDDDDSLGRAAGIQRLAAAGGPFADARARLLEAVGVGPGDSVLEPGCGVFPGARELLRRVGERGRVVGLDATRRFLELAREESASALLVVGDAGEPPVAPGRFDVVLFDKVLVHLERPRRALRAAVRALRPGGRVGAFEWDLPGIRVEGADPGFAGVLAEVQRLTTNSPEAPARLGRWLAEAGLEEVRVVDVELGARSLDPLWRAFLRADLQAARRLGLASAAQSERWWGTLERRDRGGQVRVAAAGAVAAARRRR